MFRKRLLGYDPPAVHEALTARDATLGEALESLAAAEAQAGADRAELELCRAKARAAARRITELEHVSARLATMVVDRDKELRRLRVELREALERGDEGVRAVAALADWRGCAGRRGARRRGSGCARFGRRRR
jgi:chromosome segregation ATPase